MISLVIDTAVSNLLISVVKDNEVLSTFNKRIEKDLSAVIFSALDETITNAGINKREINNVFVSVGPGSFTGVRIGVTVAKTYAWALGIKAIPVSSLEMMCSGINDTCTPLIDARRGYVFSGKYDSELNSIVEDKYVLLDSVIEDNTKYVSFDSFDSIETIEPVYDVLKIVNKHINDEGVNPHNLNPKYLKLTEAEEKLQHND